MFKKNNFFQNFQFKFCEFILTFGYLGNIKKAPGTFGSIGGVIFWLILTKIFFLANFTVFFQNFLWFLIVIIFTLFAVKKISFYVNTLHKKTAKINGIDNQTIVLDEVVGQIIALQISVNFITENYFLDFKILIIHLVLSLTLFRLFDIKKPWIIGIVDRKMKNSFGVMFDDILAGIFAGVIVWLALTYAI